MIETKAKVNPQTPTDISPVPTHVAIIMDGNGRWARQRGLPRLAGHRAGTENIRRIINAFSSYGVRYLTLYAFSTENWNRPTDEVAGLMGILQGVIHKEAWKLHEQGVRIRHLGRQDRLSPELHRAICDALEMTKNNTGLTLSVAFDYGGRSEILDAVRHMLAQGLSPEEVNEDLFVKYLYSAESPDPDLIIRTGGEMRLSNFLLWQAAYSEYYSTPKTWPDFDEEEIRKAILAFSQRQRRFGKVDKQG